MLSAGFFGNHMIRFLTVFSFCLAPWSFVLASSWPLPEQEESVRADMCARDPKCAAETESRSNEQQQHQAEYDKRCEQNSICKKTRELANAGRTHYVEECKKSTDTCAQRIEARLKEFDDYLASIKKEEYAEWCKDHPEPCKTRNAEIKQRQVEDKTWCKKNAEACAARSATRDQELRDRKSWCKSDPERCALALARLDREAQQRSSQYAVINPTKK